ncbi:hypothetical protein [Streptomyces jumonjinensis]|uniref:Uncharacterized protein n=1 Tax=Streptomyces jumonjinensis TaxID=1945 RepID=A0A646KLJ9_STRJU|nr:hypothetical protein [Streptomyces jumonjinensis]MQT02821.1 hypothetical protein [Streptomyces jumonjinensis]
MRSLDEFSAALGSVIAGAAQQAVTNTQARAVVQAAATGGEDAVRTMTENMSTADLQRLKAQLER